MREIAILAIARYGDLIQTTPLLRRLRQAHPEARITAIVEDRFQGILPLIKGIDRTIVLYKQDIAWEVATGETPLAAYLKMDAFVRQLEEGEYDLLVNITCSGLSAFLASAMKFRDAAGFIADERGQRVIWSRWGQYVFSWFNDHIRKYNPINLVDIFTRLGGVLPDGKRVELSPTAKGEEAAARFVAERKLEGKRLVGLQLGASEANRCWPIENFARLSDRLQRELGVTTVLFGAPNEKELAEKALAAMEIPAVDAVGKTSIEGLYSLVGRCAALVSNDTGTMHFAAAAGVAAVMLCIGPAFFRCTGPYGAGHVALQPDIPCSPCPYGLECGDPLCRTAITTEAVFSATRLLLAGEAGLTGRDFPGVRVYRSGFAPDGYLTWDGLFNADPAAEQLTKRREAMWKSCFDGTGKRAGEPQDEALRPFYRLMAEGAKVSAEIAEAARKRPLPVEKIKRLGEREAAIEAEVKLLGYRDGLVSPIATFLTLMRENMVETGLEAVARESHRLYETGRCLATSL
ncbi:glycosyltransferase family 9 protein [Geobacter sp.]|uniref:glycosyltransferase family 9 protein n=1 Tax=Geobacter sp. TaxID=46610 RepID=UPI00261A602C|nr:glycosyltransferase family 9 protein [Geobacter sp.]